MPLSENWAAMLWVMPLCSGLDSQNFHEYFRYLRSDCYDRLFLQSNGKIRTPQSGKLASGSIWVTYSLSDLGNILYGRSKKIIRRETHTYIYTHHQTISLKDQVDTVKFH